MTDLLTALALVLVLEGLFLAVFAGRLHWLLEVAEQLPPESLRVAGLMAAAIGVFGVWLLRG